MYRITIYENDEKTVQEHGDEDEMRDHVDNCLDDLEEGNISSFVVSRISKGTYKKPFWEKP